MRKVIIVLVYIDDIIVTSNDVREIEELKKSLMNLKQKTLASWSSYDQGDTSIKPNQKLREGNDLVTMDRDS